jgi:predicted nucleic-acid-binding Zn-ribbon protein
MTPELDCPKCGSSRTEMKFVSGDRNDKFFGIDMCAYFFKEHFHRKCFRCEYAWATDDVVKHD